MQNIIYKISFIIYFILQCSEILRSSAIITNNRKFTGPKVYLYSEQYFDVPLDHFSFSNQTTFRLRYLINETYAGGNKQNPIFFYTGNEGDIELFAQNTGFMWEAAEKLQAVVVFAEHRYYGKSLPFGNVSYNSSKYTGYLSAEQALADYAALLYYLTNMKFNSRPVIAFGGSYGGMLAAWFRMKYPHAVAGALAASAPILQFTGLTPCDIYSRIVTSVFKTADKPECITNIMNSWEVLKNYSATDKGRQILNKHFNFCKNITKADDVNDLMEYLRDMYSNLAMANYPYPNEFLAPLPAYPVRMFCGQLEKEHHDEDLLFAMNNAIQIYSNYSGATKCFDYHTAYEPNMGDLGWDFQACTEMVMPMCDNKNSMFQQTDWNFKEYSNKCFKRFGVRPNEYEIIIRYGGKNIDYASNIIFSNGLLDPWSGGGVLKSDNDKINIIIIPEGAHHIDLRAAHPDDPSSVISARIQELAIIENWINDFYFRK